MLRGCRPDTRLRDLAFWGTISFWKGVERLMRSGFWEEKTTPPSRLDQGLPPSFSAGGKRVQCQCFVCVREKWGEHGFEWFHWAYYAWNPSHCARFGTSPLRTITTHSPDSFGSTQHPVSLKGAASFSQWKMHLCEVATMQSRLHPVTQQPSTATSLPSSIKMQGLSSEW